MCVCVWLLDFFFTDVHGATPLHLARSAEMLTSSSAEPTEYVNCVDRFHFFFNACLQLWYYNIQCVETAARATLVGKLW